MEVLLNPNVAYVLIVVTILAGLLAIVIPGTGMPEAAVALGALLVGYEVYNLGINAWAVLVVALAIVPFLLAIGARRWRAPLLAVTILLLIGGSVFLFTDAKGGPAVNPVLAVIVSVLIGLFVWLVVERTIAAMHIPPANNPDSMIGKTGEARTPVQTSGAVYVGAELWSARSEKAIPVGSPVSVVGRDGFVLVVEKVNR